MVRVFANGLGDRGSIPGQLIPKTKKMILDASLFRSQHYILCYLHTIHLQIIYIYIYITNQLA